MLTIERHKATTGTLGCADRVIFHGHLTRYTCPKGPVALACQLGLLLCDLVRLLGQWRTRLCRHAETTAAKAGRPVLHLKAHQRKEDEVKKILDRDRVRRGLVCVVIAQESFWSFRFPGQKDRPAVKPDRRFGTTLYYYYVEPHFGLMHVRVNSYLPYTIQVYVNGHEWLARQLTGAGIRFNKQDNVFTKVSNIKRAQQIADRFTRLRWTEILDRFARRVNPLMKGPLARERYYWCVDQMEYATDCLFGSADQLQPLWARLRNTAILTLNGDDVMSFFGRQPNRSNFEVVGDTHRRYQGYRVKHKLGRNWIKCYDKAGSVLRVETTINDPSAFKVYRKDKKSWWTARKGLADFSCLETIARRANGRYFDALAQVDPPARSGRDLLRLQHPVRVRGRRHAGIKPLDDETIRLFAATLDARVHLRGLTNAQLRQALYSSPADDPKEERRRAARITRQLAKCRAHGLVRRIPHTHRWAPTDKGLAVMSQALSVRNSLWPHDLASAA